MSGTEPEWAALKLKEAEAELGLAELPSVSLPYRDLAMEAEAVSGPGRDRTGRP